MDPDSSETLGTDWSTVASKGKESKPISQGRIPHPTGPRPHNYYLRRDPPFLRSSLLRSLLLTKGLTNQNALV